MLFARLMFLAFQGLVREPLVASSPVHTFLELNSVQQVCHLNAKYFLRIFILCSFKLTVLQILSVVDQASYEW